MFGLHIFVNGDQGTLSWRTCVCVCVYVRVCVVVVVVVVVVVGSTNVGVGTASVLFFFFFGFFVSFALVLGCAVDVVDELAEEDDAADEGEGASVSPLLPGAGVSSPPDAGLRRAVQQTV